MTFRIWDKEKGMWADEELEKLGMQYGLMSIDMEGIAVTADNDIFLCDECGRYVWLDPKRFWIRWGK